MFDVSGLSVRYGDLEVLENLSLSLKPGTFTALVGPNGSGKSSLLKAVAGLIKAKGEVRLNGSGALAPAERHESIAYMPQDAGASSSLTVIEVILLGRLRSLGLRVPQDMHENARQALAAFNLAGLQDRTLDAISGGQRQMVFLAQTLFRDPSILLLDEPTAALDLRHQLVVLERVLAHCRSNQTVTVAAMHDLSLAAHFADHVLLLSDGGIIASGEPRTILNPSLLREVYDVETEIMESENGTLHITPLHAIASP